MDDGEDFWRVRRAGPSIRYGYFGSLTPVLKLDGSPLVMMALVSHSFVVAVLPRIGLSGLFLSLFQLRHRLCWNYHN